MMKLRQLFELQELDLEMAQCGNLISSIDNQLGDREELDDLYAKSETDKDRLNELRSNQGAEDLEAESIREKVREVEAKLYGGVITNLKELEAYQNEATFLRDHLKKLDDGLLETMVVLDEVQEKLQSQTDACKQGEEQWAKEQTELAQERQRQKETLTNLESRRQGLTSGVDPQELKLYENLRMSKGGLAIAKVERGLCRACRMSLPTHQLQRARAGREPVLCNSCGRILYVS